MILWHEVRVEKGVNVIRRDLELTASADAKLAEQTEHAAKETALQQRSVGRPCTQQRTRTTLPLLSRPARILV